MYIYPEKYMFITLILISFIHLADGTCNYPTELRDGTWHSSDMGDVTFNATTFVSSMIFDFGSLTFNCLKRTGNRYYSVSDTFTYLNNYFKVAICFKLDKVNNYKYLYYPMTSVLDNTYVTRVFFEQDTYSFTAAETCDLSSTSISQTRLLIKENFVNKTSIGCNDGIAGRYEYNLTGTSCSNTWMDSCTKKSQVTFNYTICAETMAYSAGGQLSCVWKTSRNDKYYTLLYNEDSSVDQSTYFRYTCMVSKKSNGATYVTTFPQACLEDQNATAIGSPGVSWFMIANNTCSGTSNQADDSALSAGAATAVVLALLILIAAIVVVGIWYYIKVYRIKKINPDMIAAKSPPLDTKEQEKMDGRVSPFSPYPTVSELAVYRFGPSPGPEIDDDDGGMTLDATTPGFTDGRRTMYGKDPERESQVSIPMYSEVGGETPEPTRLSEVTTRMSEISEVNIADPTPFTMTRATMNIPEETRVSPLQTPDGKANGDIQSPRDNGGNEDVTL